MVLSEVEVALDVQQGLLQEGQPLDLVLLALVEHRLHALHVLRGALGQLVQRLLILLLGLRRDSRGRERGRGGGKVRLVGRACS